MMEQCGKKYSRSINSKILHHEAFDGNMKATKAQTVQKIFDKSYNLAILSISHYSRNQRNLHFYQDKQFFIQFKKMYYNL